MVEVFKTTVTDAYYAKLLLRKIQSQFPDYLANFDLTDCDRILRIETKGYCEISGIITIIKTFGYQAEVLVDEVRTLKSPA